MLGDALGVKVPDSKLAKEITELVRDTTGPLLFNHSSRVFCFGALAGTHAKSMLISPPDVAISHLLPPYSDAKNAELRVWFDY
jgi:hypothetical protein